MRRLAVPAALAVLAVAATVASAQLVATRTPLATPSGVGALKLGRTIAALHEAKLIGGARRGCELGPGQRVAPLRPPLEGSAVFYPKDRLTSIVLTGGVTTAAGIEIGDSAAAAHAAYASAPYYRPGQYPPFAEGFIWIGGYEHPKITLVVDADSRLVREIAIARPNFCE